MVPVVSRRRPRSRLARKACTFVAFALACALSLPPGAYADVRLSDRIGADGSTVESLGLAVADCPNIDAERACLVDSTGAVYFERASDEPAQIASITKVMTALVAVENASLEDPVVVSARAASVGESSANLAEGDEMNLETALKALLIPSGNDAAVAIAECVGSSMTGAFGEEAERAFVDAMNAKARALGCRDTVYENPHGLDDGAYAGELHSTAHDQVIVAKAAMDNRTIRTIVGAGSGPIVVKREGSNTTIDLVATDALLDRYDFAIGVKTGVTNAAGPSFLGAASNGAIELYGIVLKSTSTDERFSDAQTLFEWGFEHIIDYPLVNTERTSASRLAGKAADAPVLAEVSLPAWTDKTVPATIEDPRASVRVFDLAGNVSQKVEFNEPPGAVEAGDVVGTITFLQHNRPIESFDLIACEDVQAPGPVDALAIWWKRLWSGFSGERAQAESIVYNVCPPIKDNTRAR